MGGNATHAEADRHYMEQTFDAQGRAPLERVMGIWLERHLSISVV